MTADMITVREAVASDAKGMSAVLEPIIRGWNSDRRYDPEHILERYITDPQRVRCSVAVDASGEILGFQSLKRAFAGNPYDVTTGWGIIGTYVKPGLGRRGVGTALFAASLEAARAAGLPAIDASIGETNQLGLAYYEAMGFREYRRHGSAICKRYVVG